MPYNRVTLTIMLTLWPSTRKFSFCVYFVFIWCYISFQVISRRGDRKKTAMSLTKHIEDKILAYLERRSLTNRSRGCQYAIMVALHLPLVLFMHMWAEMSPSSPELRVKCALCIVQYGGRCGESRSLALQLIIDYYRKRFTDSKSVTIG